MLTWPNVLAFLGWLLAGYLWNDRRHRRRQLERALEELARVNGWNARLRFNLETLEALYFAELGPKRANEVGAELGRLANEQNRPRGGFGVDVPGSEGSR